MNGTIFFSHSNLIPLKIIVSFINLDLGFSLCFFDGMDDLSYSKIFQNVIDIFTYADVHVRNKNAAVKVWFYDGMINYLGGKHIWLFSVAVLVSVLLVLYTLALTIMPIICNHSEKHMICIWFSRKIPLPIIDAYYAPYEGKWRFWLGVRLWLLILLYGLSTSLGPQNPSLLLLIHGILVIVFTLIQCRVMPFNKTYSGKDDKCHCSNKCMHIRNVLDLYYLLNYALLALSVSYIWATDTNAANGATHQVVVGVFVGLSIVVFICTIIIHILVALQGCRRCEVTPSNFNETSHPTNENIPLAFSRTHIHYSSDVLREPLLEDRSEDQL